MKSKTYATEIEAPIVKLTEEQQERAKIRAAKRAVKRLQNDLGRDAELLQAEQPFTAPRLVTTAARKALASQGLGTDGLALGRPSEYTQEEGDALCAWIQSGASLRSYSRNTGRSVETVYKWMREHPVFLAQYGRAHEDRADTLTDEMLDIGDDIALNPTIEGVAAAKLRVETRKWIASKLRPQRWGDKQVVEHVGAVNIRIGIPSKQQQTALETVEEVTLIG